MNEQAQVYGSHPVYLFTFCFIWKYTYTTINKISRDKAYVCSKHINPARWKSTEHLEFSACRSWACLQTGGRDVWGGQCPTAATRGTGTVVGKMTVSGGLQSHRRALEGTSGHDPVHPAQAGSPGHRNTSRWGWEVPRQGHSRLSPAAAPGLCTLMDRSSPRVRAQPEDRGGAAVESQQINLTNTSWGFGMAPNSRKTQPD